MLYERGKLFNIDNIAFKFDIDSAAFPRTNSAPSGFFFWGKIELPVDNSSGKSIKLKCRLDHSTTSSAKRER